MESEWLCSATDCTGEKIIAVFMYFSWEDTTHSSRLNQLPMLIPLHFRGTANDDQVDAKLNISFKSIFEKLILLVFLGMHVLLDCANIFSKSSSVRFRLYWCPKQAITFPQEYLKTSMPADTSTQKY